MKPYAVYGERAVMPLTSLRALLYRQRRQRETIEVLRKRLEARETLLTMTLHELALLRDERDPQTFIFRRRTKGGSAGRHLS